jgi:pimeloyl-ACP methyl ester carboxylesterase
MPRLSATTRPVTSTELDMHRLAGVWLPFLTLSVAAAAQEPSGYWSGTLDRGGVTWRLEIDVYRDADRHRAIIDLPDYGLYYREADVITRGPALDLRLVLRGDTVSAAFTVSGSAMRGSWSGTGPVAHATLTRRGAPRPRLRVEDVTFRNGDVTLHGLLLLPAGPGPFPAVVWTHGSGNQDVTTDWYRDRAYLVSRVGIASLIYDKRGVGRSSGEMLAFPRSYAADALAGVALLQNRGDVQRDRIGVAGMSQGGGIAALAAVMSPDVRFIVAGSVSGISTAEQNDNVVRNFLPARGGSPELLDSVMTLRRRLDAFHRTGEGRAALERDLAAFPRREWFMDWWLPAPPIERYDADVVAMLYEEPRELWKEVRTPALVIWGEADAAVPAARSHQVIRGALRVASNRNRLMRIFAGASHGLTLPGVDDVPWTWRMAPGAYELIAEWIRARVAR